MPASAGLWFCSHGAFRPARGDAADATDVAAGLVAAAFVLDMLEEIEAEEFVLIGRRTLADCHLAPILSACTQVPLAARSLRSQPGLATWRDALDDWPALTEDGAESANHKGPP